MLTHIIFTVVTSRDDTFKCYKQTNINTRQAGAVVGTLPLHQIVTIPNKICRHD